MTHSEPIFRLEGVTRRYADLTALDQIDFVAQNNGYISLLGPSGSGKTCLLRIIAGFEKPDAGRVWFQGQDITDLPAHERGIGFVFQNFALFPHLTIFENVAFGLRNGETTVAEEEITSRVAEAITMVGLAGLEDRSPDQISGGQKQRVALARTLVLQPKLVLLDEPLGALDANLRDRMQTELRAIRERLDVTFLHVTGSETEALAMGDSVAVLDAGKIVQYGTPDEIYDTPDSSDVALFLNRFNLFDGRLESGTFTGPFGKVPAPTARANPKDVYAIRYDRTQIFDQGAPLPGPALPVRYLANEYLGSSIVFLFEAADGKTIEVDHHLSFGEPRELEIGADYVLSWDPAHAIIFGQEVAA
ncbi:Spermidine/putrescine ABC transporter, ATP-binding protein [Sulfitobacter noctilucicola]|uniref:ABC-type Fe3+/spermidine/putrescine transport system ATPase subunit n=1 Tax=Sulfitobacter noctilucicola TaxID=1342301 RepID=A0A7W6M9I7_9RHOB|nr:ABC transporter ATP-binding protein [Sulfitobacter noctilucicola]KIN63548.1 Spermidine/putrescine ABC transporter, ATP-binding protein [Sulfitobacter noctilucicola]MBB4174943.1 ABC-type Fe3+/spermidine/putrescine transport system ATPase subunit [Sulfitobacter noctilucicola]